jgi:hypothetical protein
VADPQARGSLIGTDDFGSGVDWGSARSSQEYD